MLTRRLIACLDVRDGLVVKGISFAQLRPAGDPVELARRHADAGIDEVVLLDISATVSGRKTQLDVVRRTAETLFIPFAAGGGIDSERAACDVIEAGADKVCVNSAALREPDLVSRIAKRFGSQAVIVAIDAIRIPEGSEVLSRAGSTRERRDAVSWAQEVESRGAGEILLTSIDRDGTRDGFDCELTSSVSLAVDIPVIASGGAGRMDHFADVFDAGRADAALAASVLHFGDISVSDLKRYLSSRGVPVRVC